MKKILVANRGEIAVRIIRAARELGLKTVQVYSPADRDMLAASLADEAICLGDASQGSSAAKTYLHIPHILAAAAQSGADAVHPGYGFLSENAAFSAQVAAAGLIFIGPDAATINLMGDKVAARQSARAAGLATVPGSAGRIDSVAQAQSLAAEFGYPILIKAAAGGGGRGIRLVATPEELPRQIQQASQEAQAAFGDGGLYIEKFIRQARHIEVQILGDGQRALHVFERECSLQRRRQKIWEEAPSARLSPLLRQKFYDAAVRLAESVRYKGAGTMEFLFDDESEQFYFIEMNTRIQVEHPVSEMISGIDLVRGMIRIAAGESLPQAQSDIKAQGHAIEIRLNAEDPCENFMPSPGTITQLRIPGGPGVRFDSFIYDQAVIPPFYDSLLGKLIVHDGDRPQCLARLRRALGELRIGGVATTQALHLTLLDDPDVQQNRVSTNWLETWLPHHQAQLSDQASALHAKLSPLAAKGNLP
ncbi:MAG: acetyl-CoA carboxylase biotin carboxylase subunit [Candidatus Symbiobacter sp.]|nr:acetyl-CoA carboxylase biotin carboxylase subunit [Candidatus Symbiobacter sp.]